MQTRRAASDPDSPNSAYLRALRWLAARELSEAQVRHRLADRGYTKAAIGAAITRLIHERTLDDRRTSAAIARTEARVRRHGPRRVLAKLLASGIDRELARETVRDLFGEGEERELLQATLERRLQGKAARLSDPRERRKIYAYLVRQGFSAAAAAGVMRKKSQ